MPRYRAGEPIYLSHEGRLISPGEVFSSELPPGKAWIALDAPVALDKADVKIPPPSIAPPIAPLPGGHGRPSGRR